MTIDFADFVYQFFSAARPLLGIGVGFLIGYLMLRFLQGAFNVGPVPDDWSPTAPSTYPPPTRTIITKPEPKPAPKSTARACRYCGGEYDGGHCPNCGAPRQ